MRLAISGDHPSAVEIREQFEHKSVGWRTTSTIPDLKIDVSVVSGETLAVTCGIPDLEALLLQQLYELGILNVFMRRTPIQRRTLEIGMPAGGSFKEESEQSVEKAVFRAVLLYSKIPKVGDVVLHASEDLRDLGLSGIKVETKPEEPKVTRPKFFSRLRMLLGLAGALLLSVVAAHGEEASFVGLAHPLLRQPTGLVPFKVDLARVGGTDLLGAQVVDQANQAFRVNIVAGGAGGGGTSSSFGAAFPATGTAAGFSDGTNMVGARAFDLDTGAGTQSVLGVNLRLSGSGGSVEFGTNSNPFITSDKTLAQVFALNGTLQVSLWNSAGTNAAAISSVGAVKVEGGAASGVAKAGNPLQTGGVFNTTQPTVTNGQVVEAQSTARGALIVATGVEPITVAQGAAAASTAGWPTINGNLAATTVGWASGTAAGTTLRVTTTGYCTITVTFNQGTLTAGAVAFEASDTTAFTNAYPLQCYQENTYNLGSTYVLESGTNRSFTCDMKAFVAFQVRVTTTTAGGGTVNVGILGSSETAPAPFAPPNMQASGTISVACGGNAVSGECPSPETANSTVKINLNGLKAASIYFDAGSSFTGGVACEGSQDGVNWLQYTCVNEVTLIRGGGMSTTQSPAFVQPSWWTPNLIAGFDWLRIRGTTGMTGSVHVILTAANTDMYNGLLPVSSWGGAVAQVSQRQVLIAGTDGSTSCNGQGCTIPIRLSNAAATGNEYGVQVRVISDTVPTQSGTLSTQCADPCQGAGANNTSQIYLPLGGAAGFTAWLTATSSASFTIKFEISFDNNDWVTVNTLDYGTGNRATSFANPSGAPKQYAPAFRPGARYGRVRISSNSPTGTASFVLAASNAVADLTATTIIPGTQTPPSYQGLGATDNSTGCNGVGCGRAVIVANAAPGGSEYALIVRPIDISQAANNAAAPTSVTVDGFEVQGSALGASAAAGNVRRGVADLDGVLWVREGGPVMWNCGVSAVGATLTQCQAAPAASTSLYITDVSLISDTATAGQFTLRYGTGSNCGTGTTTIYPNIAGTTTGKMPYPANTANAPSQIYLRTPIKVPAANALCIICIATQTCSGSILGYTAP